MKPAEQSLLFFVCLIWWLNAAVYVLLLQLLETWRLSRRRKRQELVRKAMIQLECQRRVMRNLSRRLREDK